MCPSGDGSDLATPGYKFMVWGYLRQPAQPRPCFPGCPVSLFLAEMVSPNQAPDCGGITVKLLSRGGCYCTRHGDRRMQGACPLVVGGLAALATPLRNWSSLALDELQMDDGSWGCGDCSSDKPPGKG